MHRSVQALRSSCAILNQPMYSSSDAKSENFAGEAATKVISVFCNSRDNLTERKSLGGLLCSLTFRRIV